MSDRRTTRPTRRPRSRWPGTFGTCSPGESPFILAVTSNPVAYSEPLIHARLLAADPNIGLIWRKELDKRISRAALSGDPLFYEGASLGDRPLPSNHDEDMWSLGISPDTDIEKVYEAARDSPHPVRPTTGASLGAASKARSRRARRPHEAWDGACEIRCAEQTADASLVATVPPARRSQIALACSETAVALPSARARRRTGNATEGRERLP